MDLRGWNARYRTEDPHEQPTPLLVETAKRLKPGRALDLACGAGRNALWLAANGWRVTAVDGADEAIVILRRRAAERNLKIDSRVADLERGDFSIQHGAWDFIAMCYYLDRRLFEPAKEGLAPDGVLLAIVHMTEGSEEPTKTRVREGELKSYFEHCEILHYYEGKPSDASHRRAVAEIVVRRKRDNGES